MPIFELEADSVLEGFLNDGPKYKADPADIIIAHTPRKKQKAVAIAM